ncbi:MAG: hypothetical protein HGA61_01280 [Candidatus Moranbacteria bacterium]|nr:hypothetical protein [Candidatus Moranbacteria bacterium]
MILITHALVGASLGKQISNPFILAPLAIVLHFCLDTFRHGEYLDQKSTFKDTFWKIALDLFVGLFFVALYLKFSHASFETVRNVSFGVLFSLLPDLSTVLYWKFGVRFLKKIYDFHKWVHPYPKGDRRYDWNLRNNLNDILFSIIAISILIFL